MRKERRASRCPQPAVLAPEITVATSGHPRKTGELEEDQKFLKV